jgi:hypothetical protein
VRPSPFEVENPIMFFASHHLAHAAAHAAGHALPQTALARTSARELDGSTPRLLEDAERARRRQQLAEEKARSASHQGEIP